MRGVVFVGDRDLELDEFPDPSPDRDGVVLSIKASGICGSDLRVYRSGKDEAAIRDRPGPVIAGHEPCGIVVELGADADRSRVRVGDRVMVHHYRGCGRCRHCQAGWTQMCLLGSLAYGIDLHGGHADYMAAPTYTLVPLPPDMSFVAGAAVACGTGTAFEALRRAGTNSGETIAIFGQGPVGLSATLLAKALGARVIAFDLSPERRALALTHGADEALDPMDSAVDAIRDLTGGEGADVVLECSGSRAARESAIRSARVWGRVCLVGLSQNGLLDIGQWPFMSQLTILATRTFSTSGQAECAAFVAERGLRIEDLFTDRYQLQDADRAYRLFDAQKTGKGVFIRD